jgi:predicted phosphate transport protein (TIGR00153 family)
MSSGRILKSGFNMDNVIDSAKRTLSYFSIEKPDIPEDSRDEFVELAATSKDAVEELVLASRAFFRDFMAVKDHIHKVNFYEAAADKIADRLKRRIFASDIELARKNQLRFFVKNVESLSDLSEDVSERLAIYTIKRSL